MNRINVKPLSVNEVWKGTRYKSVKYKNYEKKLLFILPRIMLPEGDLTLIFLIGFSNSGADTDNPLKPFIDILQKKYGFNDNRVFRIEIEKEIVKKGEEFIDFDIKRYKKTKKSD